jgi:hypothetical protein
VAADAGDPGADPDTVRRYFFNQATSGGLTPVDIAVWKTRANPGRAVERDTRIGAGFDGSMSDDETSIYGCTTDDGFVFEIATWSRPPGAPASWRIPRDEVDAAVREVFDRYDVALAYFDPPKWWDEIGKWVDEFNTNGNERVIALDTPEGSPPSATGS